MSIPGQKSCPSVVTRTIVPASSHTPSASATAAAASKLGVYGDVQPHVVLPFVVEHAGALGKEAMGFFKECRKKVANELRVSGVPINVPLDERTCLIPASINIGFTMNLLAP